MGRARKGPWQRKEVGCRYTTDKGSKKPVKLAPADTIRGDAFRIYCEYHANTPNDNRVESGPLLTVSQLIDEYLEWTRQNRSERTCEWYQFYVQLGWRRIRDFLQTACTRQL